MSYEKEYKEKPNTGRLMPATVRKSDKSPDMWGVICIDREYVKQLLQDQKEPEFISVKLSGWKAESTSGNKYLSLTVNSFNPQNSTPQSVKKEEKDPWE